MSNRILVTGFGPFGETADNPSADLARSCAEHRILEVSWKAVDNWLESGEPDEFDVLLHLGFADRSHMTPELFARNEISDLADVRHEHRSGPIEPDAPLLVASTLWTPSVVAEALMDNRLRISEDAGTYLCNYISYRSIRRFPKKRVGFLHIPSFERMPMASQLEAISSLVETLSNAID